MFCPSYKHATEIIYDSRVTPVAHGIKQLHARLLRLTLLLVSTDIYAPSCSQINSMHSSL